MLVVGFQSTPPRREATAPLASLPSHFLSFNPRPPGGRRHGVGCAEYLDRERFNPRPPGGRRHYGGGDDDGREGVSIHAPPEGGDWKDVTATSRSRAVSIHAPPEGGDATCWCTAGRPGCFNPRPPGGRRPSPPYDPMRDAEFQSTPPRREATRRDGDRVLGGCFNPRPPGGRRRLVDVDALVNRGVSIHAPPEGGDERQAPRDGATMFQSTPPRREATMRAGAMRHDCGSFNPRPPGGRRPQPPPGSPPARVSIHAPPEGGDITHAPLRLVVDVSIHAPPEGGDPPDAALPALPLVSIHAPPEGGDTWPSPLPFGRRCFNPRPPRREATGLGAVTVRGRKGFNPRPPGGRRPAQA